MMRIERIIRYDDYNENEFDSWSSIVEWLIAALSLSPPPIWPFVWCMGMCKYKTNHIFFSGTEIPKPEVNFIFNLFFAFIWCRNIHDIRAQF